MQITADYLQLNLYEGESSILSADTDMKREERSNFVQIDILIFHQTLGTIFFHL